MNTVKTALSLSSIILILFLSNPSFAKNGGELLFKEALNLYKNLTTDSVKVKDQEIWDVIGRAFYSIYINHPDSSKAPNSLFLSGKMYEEMGYGFKSREDLDRSVERSRLFIRVYPNSNLADDAQIRIARIIEGWDKKQAYLEYEKLIDDFPNGDMVYAAKNKIQELSPFKPSKSERALAKKTHKNGLVTINQIRHWSTQNYTRVVIYLDKEMPYKSYFLKFDPNLGKPPRLYVDIQGTTVEKNLKVPLIEKGLLEEIRFGRNTLNKARVVLYIRSFEDYRVFSLKDPFRIVMDIEGEKSKGLDFMAKNRDSRNTKPIVSVPKDGEDISSLRGALGLKVKTVVIDPGHGGHDSGAIGPTGLREKNVNLKIAKALKKQLELHGKAIGISRVMLTRSNDRFIPLEERTAIAKKHNADLFISIHCNAAKNKKAYGIETYILSFTKDPEALSVAARENATTKRGLSDLKDIIQDYLLSSKIEESRRFANHVQGSVITNVSHKYKPVKNKGVKKAPFIVLIGADIPSILVETSFISNPREEKRLKSQKFLDEIANGIYSGIKRYSTEVETASLIK
ncbi:N-acetylmuramoyl-L-alanine amidase [Desulfobacterota bacterium AH_259_B03_O07]|nr:N-acetylmuramoyl-L-alanine amidase [Desulfobacterota bacterium AH_259_B03_O07]